MAVLGKRKRRASLDADNTVAQTEDSSEKDLQKLLQKHFEAAYEPLPISSVPEATSDSEDEEDLDGSSAGSSDWDGLSDTSTAPIQVISHTTTTTTTSDDALEATTLSRKKFMVLLPP